jgi:MFS transporter, FSR family, fosmidomycin resistance protein
MEKSFIADSSVAAAASISAPRTRFNVLGAISFSHFLNGMMQSLIVAIYSLSVGMGFTLIGMAIP